MDRTTVLWALVLFFGATIAFRAIQQLTEDSPVAVTLALELVVLVAIIAGVVIVVRRRR
jgi:lipopolysaccharide export LptBFGC system permease protein LptF